MSSTRSLTYTYASFFTDCGRFAIAPYTMTFDAIARSEDQYGVSQYQHEDIALAIGACAVLTFVVPILPAITTVTFAIAKIAVALALFSMFIAYPIALIDDAVTHLEHAETSPIF